MTDVHIPKMGMSTIEVDVTKVLVNPGQHVKVGDPIVEIESEKVTYEIVADVAGTIAQLLVAEGDVREVGDVVAKIREE